MTADEQQVLKDLSARGLSGAKALLGVFPPQANQDNSGTVPGDGVDRWYSHQFALSGGDEFKPDPSGLYDKPVTYRTFFQVAVQKWKPESLQWVTEQPVRRLHNAGRRRAWLPDQV